MGVRIGLLEVTVESISSADIGTRHWTDVQGAAAVVAAEECTNNADLEWLLPARQVTKRVLDSRVGLLHGRTILNPDSQIVLYRSTSIMNRELTFADGASTLTKMVHTDDGGLIQPYTEISWRFSQAKTETLPLHRSIAINLKHGYNWPYGRIYNFSELGGAMFTPLCELRSRAHMARSWISTERSHSIWTDWWVGIFLWWTICHRIDYGTAMKSQWKTDIMEVSKYDI